MNDEILNHEIWLSFGGRGGKARGRVKGRKTSIRKLLDTISQPLVDTSVTYGQYMRLPQDEKANVLFFDKRPASREVQTKELWVYDCHTNVHKTLKTKRLTNADLEDFVRCYHDRKVTERFRRFSYEELAQRDKRNLDIFWLKDDSLEDIDDLPEPDVLSAEIVENLEAALEQFRSVSQELAGEPG